MCRRVVTLVPIDTCSTKASISTYPVYSRDFPLVVQLLSFVIPKRRLRYWQKSLQNHTAVKGQMIRYLPILRARRIQLHYTGAFAKAWHSIMLVWTHLIVDLSRRHLYRVSYHVCVPRPRLRWVSTFLLIWLLSKEHLPTEELAMDTRI